MTRKIMWGVFATCITASMIIFLFIAVIFLTQKTTMLQEQNDQLPIPLNQLVPTLLPSIVIIDAEDDNGYASVGTGFFITPRLIVTAWHVVEDKTKINVSMYDHLRSYESSTHDLEYNTATVVGYDPTIDIVVLQLNDENVTGVPLTKWNSTELGETVISIGHPYNYEYTVTEGVVSYVNRRDDEYEFNKYIQLDAQINRGNSGGPLFNNRGHLVGVARAVLGHSGIAMAIEAGTVIDSVSRIVSEGGEVKRASFGAGMAMEDGLAVITMFLSVSPAFDSGILIGDKITSMDGVQYRDILAMVDYIQTKRPGDVVEVTVIRNKKNFTIPVTLGTIDNEGVPESFDPAGGVRVQ